jgi:hypothetical protein
MPEIHISCNGPKKVICPICGFDAAQLDHRLTTKNAPEKPVYSIQRIFTYPVIEYRLLSQLSCPSCKTIMQGITVSSSNNYSPDPNIFITHIKDEPEKPLQEGDISS